MYSPKEMIDKAILELGIGERIEVQCPLRDADSLRVRLSREITKLKDFNPTLANQLWVTRNRINNDTYMVTLGRGYDRNVEHKINIIKSDGTVVPYSEGEDKVPEVDSYDVERMRSLMEKDGLSKEAQEQILNGMEEEPCQETES